MEHVTGEGGTPLATAAKQDTEIASLASRAPAIDAAALASYHVLSGTPCKVTACAGYIDDTAPTADYFVQLNDAATSISGGGAVTPLAAPLKVKHASGVVDYVSFVLPAQGVTAANGATVQLSSTLGTGTLAGAYLVAGGAK